MSQTCLRERGASCTVSCACIPSCVQQPPPRLHGPSCPAPAEHGRRTCSGSRAGPPGGSDHHTGMPLLQESKGGAAGMCWGLPVCDGMLAAESPAIQLRRAHRSRLAWPLACTQPATSHTPCHPSHCLPCCLQAAGIPYSEYELSEQLEVSQTCHIRLHPTVGAQPARKITPPCRAVKVAGWLPALHCNATGAAATASMHPPTTCLHPSARRC